MTELKDASTNANPVFGYRAGFRRTASAIQRWSLRVGFLGALLGGLIAPFALFGPPVQRAAAGLCLAGCTLLAAGLGWGFWWRGYLRAEFRRRFPVGTA